MYIQPIMPIRLKNSNCKTIVNHKENLKTETNSTILPSFVDAKSYANINFKAKIHDYVLDDNLKRVKQELAKGFNVNIQDEYGWTLLHYACQYGQLAIAKFLCKQNGIDINIQNIQGETPLHNACYFGYLNIVKFLCKQEGIDINCRSNDGHTPLHYACMNGASDVVKLLCKQEGTDINCRSYDGNTPLHLACKNGYADVVKLLYKQE